MNTPPAQRNRVAPGNPTSGSHVAAASSRRSRPSAAGSRSHIVVLLIALAALPAGAAPPRPNILFILADDLGYGDLGVLFQNAVPGDKKFATPSLDRMAAGGAILTRHYCGAPVCAPSRASLLAGVHQGHTQVRNTDFDDALGNNHTLATTRRGFDFFHVYVRHADGSPRRLSFSHPPRLGGLSA